MVDLLPAVLLLLYPALNPYALRPSILAHFELCQAFLAGAD